MNAWKWQDQPRRVPVAVLSGRSHINHRHLALIREQRDAEPVAESLTIFRSVTTKAEGFRTAALALSPATVADGSH